MASKSYGKRVIVKVLVLLGVLLGVVAFGKEDALQMEAKKLYELKKYKEAYELLSGMYKKEPSYKGLISNLQTDKLNYFAPFSHRLSGDYRSYDPSKSYTNTEAEFQISVRYDFYENLFGLGEVYSIGYTQKSFWQIYKYSTPFRETNYHPDISVSFPLTFTWHKLEVRSVKLSIEHESNGQGDISEENFTADMSVLSEQDKYWLVNSSRSWNFLALEWALRYEDLQAKVKLWSRIAEDRDTDDNHDLIDYIGFGELNLFLPYKKHNFFLTGRYNFLENLGSLEISYAYPMFKSENMFWFAKYFTGFGESLIDYNTRIDKVSIGFRFLYP
jgi:phospholipase A1